jgi:MoxR-like ATPase
MPQDDDVQAIARLNESFTHLRQELAKAVVGQREVIDQLLIALFAGGHCLLVGVPGLAKTLLVRTLAETLSLKKAPTRCRRRNSTALCSRCSLTTRLRKKN